MFQIQHMHVAGNNTEHVSRMLAPQVQSKRVETAPIMQGMGGSSGPVVHTVKMHRYSHLLRDPINRQKQLIWDYSISLRMWTSTVSVEERDSIHCLHSQA